VNLPIYPEVASDGAWAACRAARCARMASAALGAGDASDTAAVKILLFDRRDMPSREVCKDASCMCHAPIYTRGTNSSK
jgi:hypothetical protein